MIAITNEISRTSFELTAQTHILICRSRFRVIHAALVNLVMAVFTSFLLSPALAIVLIISALLTAVTQSSQAGTWTEGWEKAAIKTYIPQGGSGPFITGDKGKWYLGDTASNFGVTSNRAEIVTSGSGKALRLVTADSGHGAENMWVATTWKPSIPVTPGTLLSVHVTGRLVDPEWGSWRSFPTCCPPPGDNVHLMLQDDRGNMLVYLFQRSPEYVPHTTLLDVELPSGQAGEVGYHEIFIDTYDSSGGTYRRDLYSDFQNVPHFSGGSISMIVFSITSIGEATMDGLSIGTSLPDDPPPTTAYQMVVQVNGQGDVSPNLNGQLLKPATTYKMTAKPKPGYVFAGWTGTITTNLPAISFVPHSDMTLQANFVPNPFTPVKGTYTGLVAESGGASQRSSGIFTVTVTDKGTLSGSLQVAGTRYSVSGQFDSSGKATLSPKGGSSQPLTIHLQLDLASGTDRITGTLTDGTWTAQVEGDRAVFDGKSTIATTAGTYTLVIPGSSSSAAKPAGDSFGTVTVDKAGKIRFAGSLADGTKITQAAAVSKSGEWPLYVPVDKGRGFVLSWVTFASTATEDLAGQGVWIKPSAAGAKYYGAGFSMNMAISGSRYDAPGQGNNPLALTELQAVFSAGNLSESVTQRLTLDTKGKVTNLKSKEFSLTFTPKSGLFSGRMTVAATGNQISFGGAVLQKQKIGCGYFLGATQSGRVRLAAAQ